LFAESFLFTNHNYIWSNSSRKKYLKKFFLKKTSRKKYLKFFFETQNSSGALYIKTKKYQYAKNIWDSEF